MRYIYIIAATLLAGCGRVSVEKAVKDCNFDAAKASGSSAHQDKIAAACMESKGYEMSNEPGCSVEIAKFPLCWKRTWRVVLP